MPTIPQYPRRRLFSAFLAASLTLLGSAPNAGAEKPDPSPFGGSGPAQPLEKADPGTLGVQEMPPELVARFQKKYDEDFGPPVAVVAFVSAQPGQRALHTDTRLLESQIRRVWTRLAPGVEMVDVEANAGNRAQALSAEERNDPTNVREALNLPEHAELVLLLECFPNTGRGGAPDFDVAFRLMSTVKGNTVAEGRGQWFNSRQVQPAEILARAITRDVWSVYAPENAAPPPPRRFRIVVQGLQNRAEAKRLSDALADVTGQRTRLADFVEGRDLTRATLQARLAADIGDVADMLAEAAEISGLNLAVDTARGTDIVARTTISLDRVLERYRAWLEERQPRHVRLVSGWSLSQDRSVGGIDPLAAKDITGADFMRALSNNMIGRLAPITNDSYAALKDQAITNAVNRADESALAGLLSQRFPDQIIWFVSARPVNNNGEEFFRTTVMIVDTQDAQTLVLFNDDYLKGFDERSLQTKADEYIARALNTHRDLERFNGAAPTHPASSTSPRPQAPHTPFSAVPTHAAPPMPAGRARRISVLVAGLESAYDRDLLEDALIANVPGGESSVVIRDATQPDPSGESAVEVEIRSVSRASRVSRQVREAIFNELGWPVHEYALNPAVILRVKNALDIPEWAAFTGPPDKAGDLLPRLNNVLRERGSPTVLTFMQSDDGSATDATLDTLQTRINEHLATAGVTVLDTAVGPELAQRLRAGSAGTDDRTVAGALRDVVRAEWVVLGYVRQTPDGLAGRFRLIDLRRAGSFISGVTVPDHDTKASRKVRVDTQDPASVARYVAGRTLGGLLRLEGQPHRLEVVVRGAESGDQVLALGQQIATNLPAVTGIEGLYFSPTAAGFYAVHRGGFEQLAPQIDRVRDGLPFTLTSARFDEGVWVMDINPPGATGPVAPILPGQGVLVAPPQPPSHTDAGANMPAPSGTAFPRSRLTPRASNPDAAEEFKAFVAEHHKTQEIVDSWANRTGLPGRVPAAADQPTAPRQLVIRGGGAANTRGQGGSLSFETRPAPQITRGAGGQPPSVRQLTAAAQRSDDSVLLSIPDLPLYPFTVPGIAHSPVQWALNNPVYPGMDTAWHEVADSVTNLPKPLVAVVDSGLYTNDPRLAALAWKNPGEIPGNGRDDDGNDLIDDVHGYHFAEDTGTLYPETNLSNHGSFCASIIGGRSTGSTNDVIGLAPGTPILAVGGLGFDGKGGANSAVFKSMHYAMQQGAKVINLSLGGNRTREFVDALSGADALWQEFERRNVLLVIAAGNENSDNDRVPIFPANLKRDNVISVMAIDPSGLRARAFDGKKWVPYSNYGKTTVHIAAPGSGILGIDRPGSTKIGNGTSYAAPMVSAAAALIWAKHPDWDFRTVKRAILESARPVAGLEDQCITGGMLDLAAALAWTPDGTRDNTPTTASPTPPPATAAPVAEVPVAVSATPPATNTNIAVTIGVNNLYDNRYADDLRGAVPDAQALCSTLTRFAGYRQDRVTLLIDGANGGTDNPTAPRIMHAVRAAAAAAGPSDTLLVSFSGHGLLIRNKQGVSHSVLAGADYAGTVASGVLVSELRQIMESSRAREKVLLIDACHAGTRGELPPLNPKDSFEGAGIVTLASCTFDQQSLEDPEKGLGVFTHWITRGLNGEARGDDREVTVFELFKFVSDNVPAHAHRVLSNHVQTPVFYGTLRNDFPIVEFK